MEITLADQRALVLTEQLSIDQAEGRAWSKKIDAFGRMVKMTRFVQRPKDEDFELIYKEHRYQPFWHIACRARYIYERRREYPLPLSGPEVETVSIEGKDYQAVEGRLTLTGLEHCREEPHKEAYVEGLSNVVNPALASYLKYEATEIPMEELDEFAPEGVIAVPPQSRASAVVHEVLTGMIKSVQADRILEDSVEVERVDLYYRPVYAFQYRWLSKEREAVLEYDALTGQLEAGGKTFQQYMGKILDPEFLFDVGVDTVDLLVPGGGIAVKLARKGIDAARSRGKRDT
jgi:hypothetical protein